MRAILSLLALIFSLSSCWSIPVDVSFATDPRILRGTWTGTLEKGCVTNLSNATFSPDGTRFFVISFTQLEVFDANNTTKLGGFPVANLKSPVVWSSDNTNLIFLRKPDNSALERVVVNALNGVEVSKIVYSEEFLGEVAGFSSDLTSMIVTLTSATSGVTRANRYDLLNGTLIKSLVLPSKDTANYKVSPDGAKLSYQTRDTTQNQVWVANFSTDVISKEFDVATQFARHQFATNQEIIVFYTPNNLPDQTVVRRINLSNSSSQETTIPRAYEITFSQDLSRYAIVQNDILYIKNFATGATIAQKPMQSTISDPYNSYSYAGNGFVISSNTNGTTWAVSGTKIGCTMRLFETTQQTFSMNIAISDLTKSVTMTFIPVYVSSSNYSLTGTMKIGNDATINIKGIVSVPNTCSVFSGTCENLKPKLSPPIPYYNQFEINHFANLTDENNQSLGYSPVIVGKRKDNKKVELFGLQSNNNQEGILVLRLNPPSTP